MPGWSIKAERIESGILKDVNFSWEQGERLALMGANGSGKSTLARVLAGLKDKKGALTLYRHGTPYSSPDLPWWQVVGMVGQHPRRQCIGASVAEELSFGLLNLGHSVARIRTEIGSILEKIGLKGRENQSPATLSGGERQRLVLAAILALNPLFLILDEAFSMVDEQARRPILAMLEKQKKEVGQLWITHDPELALKADRLLLIKDGRLEDAGSPQDGLENEQLCAEYGIRPWQKRAFKPAPTWISGPGQRPTVLEWENGVYGEEGGFSVRINRTVKKSEFIGILGASGAGKTTVLESAAGLNKARQGRFQIPNQARVYLLQQEAGEFIFSRSVREAVFGPAGKKAGRPPQEQERQDYLRQFGITEDKSLAAPEQLSGGERQILALARALWRKPELLLLDEPLLSLDGPGRALVEKLLAQITGVTTILYATHDLREVLPLAHRLWLMNQGEITVDCAAREWGKHQASFRAAGVKLPE